MSPLQLLEGPPDNPLTHPKVRCQHHAEGPVNWTQIAEDDARRALATQERSIGGQPTTYVDVDKLPFDGKAAAAGE